MAAEYPVPKGFRLVSRVDTRSDDEIADELQQYRPVADSEKNVWAFWHSGWTDMRPWCQRNVINWVRRLGPEWTVRILDNVPDSPNYMTRFAPTSYFPDTVNNGAFQGMAQHLSDILRLPLLLLHGGVWIDVGTILHRDFDHLCWRAIEDPDTPYELALILVHFRTEIGTCLNGFIASRRNNGMIRRWHEVYCALWDGRTSSDGFNDHPLLAHLPPIDINTRREVFGFKDGFVVPSSIGDYTAHFTALERVRHLQDPTDGFDGPEYFANKVFLMDSLDTIYYAQKLVGWDGRRLYDLLCTKIDDVDAPFHAEAKSCVDELLRKSPFTKVSLGPPHGTENLTAIWNAEDNKDADNVKGTFANYLRHATVHWDCIDGRVGPIKLEKSKLVFTAGLLEVIPKS